MKKVWLTVVSVAALTLALALPAVAAVPNGNTCNNWNYANTNGTVIQSNVPSNRGNCPAPSPVKTNPGASQCPKLDVSKILQMAQTELTDCLNGLFGGLNCQNQNNNCN